MMGDERSRSCGNRRSAGISLIECIVAIAAISLVGVASYWLSGILGISAWIGVPAAFVLLLIWPVEALLTARPAYRSRDSKSGKIGAE